MIRVTSTDFEYLIALPYNERHRAKRIPGYRWDPRGKLWRYLKNDGTRKAIMAEFGPEETEWLGHEVQNNALASDQDVATRYGEALQEYQDLLQLTRETHESNKELLKVSEEYLEQTKTIVELWNTAEQHGLAEGADYDEFVQFTKAAYEGNYRHADLAAKLASTEVQLYASQREAATLRRASGYDGDDNFRKALIQEAWGKSTMPQIVRDFSFDGHGAIELQNYLSKILVRDLHKGSEHKGFADLIREAEDARLLSSNAARVCHTLRIQRNFFAHESVEPEDIVPRACLCLFSFIIVYRELTGGDGLS